MLRYPEYTLSDASESLGTLTHPDIRAYHDACIGSNFDSEIAYEQGVLTVLHRFDEARMMPKDEHDLAVTFAGIALCLADIHYQTGHYNYCTDELTFLRRISRGDIHTYASAALDAVASMTDTVSLYDRAITRTEISLY